MKKSIVIIGAGGLGREILVLLKSLPAWEPIGFLDDALEKSSNILGLPVLGSIDQAGAFLKPHTAAVIAIGDPKMKADVASRIQSVGLCFPVLIHPNAVIMNADRITLGEGTVIGAGAILTTDISVGRRVFVNINVTIGHDVIVGDNVSIMPGANIAGSVNVGSSVLIGAGANIRNGLRIGENSLVAMGASVVKDVAPGLTVAGVPAKPLL